MADPRFFENHGPFFLRDICSRAGVQLPKHANGDLAINDVATLDSARSRDISFCAGKEGARLLASTKAAACFIGNDVGSVVTPPGTLGVPCGSATYAIGSVLRDFYPDNGLGVLAQVAGVDPSASIAQDVTLAPGVVVGEGAEIGRGTKVGANAFIGKGVTIGQDCEIGANVSIQCALIGDNAWILSGAQIGSPGFGFASGRTGHTKIPQVGRVIIQDKVEVGACSTIDRGMLGDTVIGEGTKIDNLVQIGHNTRIGRHCIIVSQVGISGSCEIGDFVVFGGQAGVADHVSIGDGARFAGRSGVYPGTLAGNQDYGGVPARPIKQWLREVAMINKLGKARRKNFDA
jgi:UDP-3-O-[3-hydroxymyristoyl] glucosamine N-acyltransferase